MTISTELRKAGPFTGNGATTAFPFSFKVFAASDVTVTRADTLGAETVLVLNTDFTVALNADQDAAPGGAVTLAAPLASGHRLVVSSAVPNLQPTDITNNGGFYPRVIEDALDRHVAQIQQLQEQVDRAAKLPITNPGDAAALTADLVRLADSADEIDTVAGSIAGVNTVAEDIAEVNTVAGIAANVTTVAGIAANVTAVAAIDDDVSVVAANIADVQNAEENASTAVAAASTAVAAAATAQSLAAQLQDGVRDRFVPGTDFTAGVTTSLELSLTPAKAEALFVFFNGVCMERTDYALVGDTLTFTEALPAVVVEVVYFTPSQLVGLSANDLEQLGEAIAASNSALVSAASAADAKTAAEAARDAAQLSAGVYATTAAGLAATTSGKYFSVPATRDSEYLILYFNSSGSAVEVKRYPSSQVIYTNFGSNALAAWTDGNDNVVMYLSPDGKLYTAGNEGPLTDNPREVSDSGGPLVAWTDSNDEVVMHLTRDGKLYVAGNSGPLTDSPQISDASADSLLTVTDATGRGVMSLTTDGRLRLLDLGNVFDKVASNDFVTGQEYASFGDTSKANYFFDKSKHSLGSRIAIHNYLVGPKDDAGTSFCRFPFALPLTDSTGLLFFSQRREGASSGEERQRTVVRSYSIDYASKSITTSATRVIDQPSTWASGAGGYAAGPSAVLIPSGRVIVVYNKIVGDGLISDASYERAQYMSYSDDSGQSWSTPVKIMGSDQLYNTLTGTTGGIPGAVPARNGCVTGTENCFILIPTGPYAGRLVHSIYTFGGYLGAMYSDDNGATWTRGTLVAPISEKVYNESGIAYCSDGSIVMLARCENVAGVGRFVSIDGGATWTYTGHVSNGFGNSSVALINASISASTGFEKLVAACTASTQPGMLRNKFRVRLSYDKGQTFSGDVALFPDAQGVGYSNLVRLSNGLFILAYETFAAPGEINTDDGIGMYVFNEAEMFSKSVLL